MPLLIDGYNVLFELGWLSPGRAAPGVLQLRRRRLLGFLAAALTPEQREKTTVVFDAAEAPADLPRQQQYEGITVLFSATRQEADELIEQLIAGEGTPRALEVVSSDHRIRQAAQRRGATSTPSRQWMERLARERFRRQHQAPARPEKPETPPPEEVQFYMDLFAKGDLEQLDELWDEPQADQSVAADVPQVAEDPAQEMTNPYYPFPPDYFDDLDADEDK